MISSRVLANVLSVVMLALTAGCQSSGSLRVRDGVRLDVQDGASGPARFVGFVHPSASSFRDGAHTDFALVLPGDDWLVVVDDTLARLSPDGRDVRWSQSRFAIWDAVLAPATRVVAVGTIADPHAPDGVSSCMFALDTATGAVLWRATPEPLKRGAYTRLARVGAMTVLAGIGESGVDDSGNVRWTSRSPGVVLDPAIVALESEHAVLIATALPVSTNDITPEPQQRALLVRTIDPETGLERGRFALPAAGDCFWLSQLALTNDHRVALRVDDIRLIYVPGETADHRTVLMRSQDKRAQIIVIDFSDPAHLTGRAMAMPSAIDAPLTTKLAPSEVAYGDWYASGTETLGVTIVDVATMRARRSILLRPIHVAVGEGMESFVQVLRLTPAVDRMTFAGIFAGSITALRARVRVVDRCEFSGDLECRGGRYKGVAAPFAGVVGTIAFTR